MAKRNSERAPADAPSRYIDPEFKSRKKAEEADLQRLFDDLAGPVTISRVCKKCRGIGEVYDGGVVSPCTCGA